MQGNSMHPTCTISRRTVGVATLGYSYHGTDSMEWSNLLLRVRTYLCKSKPTSTSVSETAGTGPSLQRPKMGFWRHEWDTGTSRTGSKTWGKQAGGWWITVVAPRDTRRQQDRREVQPPTPHRMRYTPPPRICLNGSCLYAIAHLRQSINQSINQISKNKIQTKVVFFFTFQQPRMGSLILNVPLHFKQWC